MNTQQLQAITGLVEPLVRSEDDRHALIAEVFPGDASEFDLSGDSDDFVCRLVYWLHDRGQLEALLSAIHDRVDAAAQAQIAVLKQPIATLKQPIAAEQRGRWIALAVILLAVVSVVVAGLLIRQAVDEQNTANIQQTEAEQRIADASTQVAVVAQTLTAIPPTLTQVAVVQQEALKQQDIAIGFANALLDVDSDPQNALNQANDLVDRYPEAASVYLTHGLLYADMERYDDAIADYTYALELDPTYTFAYSARQCLREHGGALRGSHRRLQ